MHDLRTQVYRHLQRLSLAFFTRTRTGEIQSRIANDIGGVQNVVTTHRDLDRLQRDDGRSPPSSRCSCSTGGWRCSRSRCCRSSCCWRAASATSGARSPTVKQGAMADISSLVQESLSVSGILLGKTMGRGAELAERFERRVGEPGRPRGPLAHGRPLDDGLDPDLVRGHAGARLPVRRPRARARSRSARSSRSPRCRRGCSSRSSRCSASASTSRPRWRCSSASSSTSTSPVDIHPGTRDAATTSRGEVAFDDVWFRYGDDAGRCATSTSTSRPARAPRWSARPARARRRSATSPRGSTTPSAARCASTAPTCAT